MSRPPPTLHGTSRQPRLVAAALAVVLIATLWPANSAGSPPSAVCIWCGEFPLADVLQNVLLFLPFGLALRWSGASLTRLALLSCGVSAGVEIAQGLFQLGRDPSVRDVVANAAGGAFGGGALMLYQYLRAPERRRRARLVLMSGLLAWGAGALVASWAMSPDVPKRLELEAQLVRENPGKGRFRGRVLHVTLDDVSGPDGPLPTFWQPQDTRIDGRLKVTIATAGLRPVDGIADVFAVSDGSVHPLIWLDMEDCHLYFGRRRQADRLGLRSPFVRLSHTCHASADTLELVAASSRDLLSLGVERRGRFATRSELRVSPASTWMLVLPQLVPDSVSPLLGALWLTGLSLPIGLITRLAYPAAAWAWLYAVGVLGLELFAVQAIIPLAHPAAADLLATATGFGLGVFAARPRAG
jgi:hypothetical protein